MLLLVVEYVNEDCNADTDTRFGIDNTDKSVSSNGHCQVFSFLSKNEYKMESMI